MSTEIDDFSYKTVKKPVADILLKEKGSKFIGYAFPVNSEEAVKNALAEAKNVHPKATHHCYAFRLGLQGDHYRANDDGEPSGSAGLPIYNQLLSHEVTNILLIVVRYYGGTKLGVSGLVRAYREMAKMTLEAAEIIVTELTTTIKISFDFNQQNIIFTLLNRFGAAITDFQSAERCTITADLKTVEKENISAQLAEMQYIEFDFLN